MKTSLKLLFVFITTILLFTSCDKDFYEDVELQKNNLESIDVKTITYDEFKRKLKSVENKPAVKMILNNTNSIRHFARSGDDSEIEIFTDVIKEITSGTYKSYTMYIKTSDTIASRFYNLTLEEKEGNTDAFITKYSPTENWLDDKSQPFEGGITTFRVEPGPGGSIKFTHVDEEGGGEVEGSNIYPIACDGTVQTTIIVEAIMCSEFVHWPWSPTTPPCNASVKAKYKYTYRYECVPGITFPGSGGSNPGGSSPVGGNSPGSSQPGEPSNSSLTTIVGVPDMPRVSYLTEPLSLDARQNDYLINNPAIEDQLGSYIDQNTINDVIDPAAMAFAQELIDLARFEPNQADVSNLVSLTILIENSGDQLFTEQFEASLVRHTDLYEVYPQHEYPLMALTLKTFANYKKLREINPEWSRTKCIFYASKDIIHLSLDAFGLVPVFGEPADLINGLLYTIEGDNLNASLSYASAVPVLGWASSTTKFGLKVVNIANDVNTKVKLVWKVGVNGIIEFGSSSQLRKVLNITSSSLQAHHLMPWAHRAHDVIQKAAKSGNAFHLNEALNGIAVATWRNQPNHNVYNNLVKSKLDNYLAEFPNATPQQCYSFVSNLVNDIRDWVVSHPNSHLNDLVLP